MALDEIAEMKLVPLALGITVRKVRLRGHGDVIRVLVNIDDWELGDVVSPQRAA